MAAPEIEYQVSYRNVKYPRLELKTGQLLLVLPAGRSADSILKKHKKWVKDKLDFIQECLETASGLQLSERSADEFVRLVRQLAEKRTQRLGIQFNNIFFRNMRTKWASCSPNANLTVNKLARQLPDDVLDYLVLHESLHLIERRHNEQFWRLLRRKCTHYQHLEKRLFSYWFTIAAGD